VTSSLADDLIAVTSIAGANERQERLVHFCLMLAHLLIAEQIETVQVNQHFLRALTDAGKVRNQIAVYSRPSTAATEETPLQSYSQTKREGRFR
jgi:hypothetical protein